MFPKHFTGNFKFMKSYLFSTKTIYFFLNAKLNWENWYYLKFWKGAWLVLEFDMCSEDG